MVATWYGDDSPHLSCPTASRVSVAVRGRARVTGKAGENGQNSGEVGGSSAWTRPSAPGCGDTSKASACFGSIWGGNQGILAPGSPSTASSDGRQAYVRAMARAWPSVIIVGPGKVSAGSGWPVVGDSSVNIQAGGRWSPLGCASGKAPREPEDHKPTAKQESAFLVVWWNLMNPQGNWWNRLPQK